MEGLAVPAGGDLLVSDDSSDDAAVYRLSADQAIVFTVDIITPLVSDPDLFGRLAATNAISDVYAMGGKPLLALNICCFPKAAPKQELNRILRGGLAQANTAGCLIVGGHTVKDDELKYGLAVVGLVHPDRVRRNSSARPGDVLILTKPIGSGVLFTGVRKGRIPEDVLLNVARSTLCRLNDAAAEVAQAVDCSAATDVTGFGLGGHLRNMARGAGVGIRIRAREVPVFPHALELIREGLGTGATGPNQEALRPILRVEDPALPPERIALLSDPQTAGGLVLAVHPSERDRAVRMLEERGASCAAVIGEVFDTGGEPVIAVA
jgi:selenide,water dikinase